MNHKPYTMGRDLVFALKDFRTKLQKSGGVSTIPAHCISKLRN